MLLSVFSRFLQMVSETAIHLTLTLSNMSWLHNTSPKQTYKPQNLTL